MKKRKFRFQLLVLVLVAIFAITGCSGSSTGSGGSGTDGSNGGSTDSPGKGSGEKVTINLATVNNPDMTIMQELAPKFTEETGIEVNFIVLPENELRNKVTTDVGLGAGNYDIVTLGTYEVPFWGNNQWLEPLNARFDGMSEDEKAAYDKDDLIKPAMNALSYEGEVFGLPFYAESTMLFYRKDLLEAKGLTMPEKPTWDEVYEIAGQLHDPKNGVSGMCLRGLSGWGQNMFIFTQMLHTFGGKWFDMDWNPQFDSPEMRETFEFYKKMLTDAGEPSPYTAGYTECLTLMQTGKAAMWMDATVSGGTLMSGDSQVKDKIGYAMAPVKVKDYSGAVGGWALSIASSSKHKDEAFRFLSWATSKKYVELVGEQFGWERAPSGTRVSTYENPKYLEAAPFAAITLESINNANYEEPAVDPVPYKSSGWVSIPEYQEIGDQVGQEFSAYLAGTKTLDEMLQSAQKFTTEVVKRGGYLK